MAAHYFETRIELHDFSDQENSNDFPADAHAPTEEIQLGAFRGLAYALVFETALVILGSFGWELWRVLH